MPGPQPRSPYMTPEQLRDQSYFDDAWQAIQDLVETKGRSDNSDPLLAACDEILRIIGNDPGRGQQAQNIFLNNRPFTGSEAITALQAQMVLMIFPNLSPKVKEEIKRKLSSNEPDVLQIDGRTFEIGTWAEWLKEKLNSPVSTIDSESSEPVS